MIDRIIAFSVHKRWLVIAAGLVLTVAGVYALYQTPVDAIPDLSENQVMVFTQWPGRGPVEIEDQVTYPLSLHLQGLPGVRVVRASSDFGFSMINVIFEEGVGFAEARERVAQRIAGARERLPAEVTPALAPDAAATGQIFWYTVEGEGLDLGELRALHDWTIRPQLSAVAGVAEVASVGGFSREYTVELDPLRLRAHHLTAAEVLEAVSRSNGAVGGGVLHKGGSEYIVRGDGRLGLQAGKEEAFDSRQVLHDLENVPLPGPGGLLRLADVASVVVGGQPRRGVLEKDGSEVTGGVVVMRQGENPLVVTRRLRDKIQDLQTGLPEGVRIVPFYDRTPLIHGAIGTVTTTLLEAILTATVCVVLVLLHLRTSFVIAVTLPLAALAAFLVLWLLRLLGVADVQTNVMSLAGIAISVGILADSSIVIAENVMHRLKEEFGDRPVRGDVRRVVLSACQGVGRPIFFSVLIMLLSFLPVFALGGMQGKMFRPLAVTKSLALTAVAVLSITLVPALCTVFIRGRLRGEMDSWLVRGVVKAYRPLLGYFLDRPAGLVWLLGATFVVGLAPLGVGWLFLLTLTLALIASAWVGRHWLPTAAALGSLILLALAADTWMQPLESELMTPLDEGMTMDMPISWPRASVSQAADDLKARDMILCRFPEVDMVVGKAGRAETALDPAPLDMIETMVNFRPAEFWPRRKLPPADAERQAHDAVGELLRRGLIADLGGPGERKALAGEAAMAALPRFDALMRECAYQSNQEFERDLGRRLVLLVRKRTAALLHANGALQGLPEASELARLREPGSPGFSTRLARDLLLEDVTRLARDTARQLQGRGLVPANADPFRASPSLPQQVLAPFVKLLGGSPSTPFTRLREDVVQEQQARWRAHLRQVDAELLERAPAAYTALILEEVLERARVMDSDLADALRERKRLRSEQEAATVAGGHHHGAGHSQPAPPTIDPCPALDGVQSDLGKRFADGLVLLRKDRSDLTGFGGELDRVMQMPGWTNVWTMPIQNRVDMLATGVNTTVGVRVLGRNLDDVVAASREIAAVLQKVRGAPPLVAADPVRGKGYLEVRPDREKAARYGVSTAEINELVEIALGGRVATVTAQGRERTPVRVRYARSWREDEEQVARLPVLVRKRANGGPGHVLLGEIAQVRITEGPATIKSENGLLRNYVRLNVHGRSAADFVAEAQRVVAEQVQLPPGVFIEWTGQIEHEERAQHTLLLIVPLVVALIFLVLYLTYRDLADAVLMLLAVPGAVAGGIFFQWLFGCKLSVTVWLGYIACFGMATSTGIIMLVYLREAVARGGGLAKMTEEQLRQAVLNGAVQRLRPKLLTECTTIIGLAPLLWGGGVGAEVIRPMVLPVIGGLLIADEVIDLFLPVLFYRIRRRRWLRLHAGAAHS